MSKRQADRCQINFALTGAVHAYGSWEQEGGSYIGNKAQSSGATGPDAAGGGAFMDKGAKVVFEDVLFQNNSAVALNTDTGYAYGGAIMVDYSTGNATGVTSGAELTIRATKDMTYSGNTVSSTATADFYDTYGYHLNTPTAGGFLFLDRGSSAVFEVTDGATLTIGASVTDDDTDSIASSIPNSDGNGIGEPAGSGWRSASITKTGSGTLTINSSLNKYYGTFNVAAGTMNVNSHWDLKNAVSIGKNASLSLASFKVLNAEQTGNLNAEGEKVAGSITVDGTLATLSDQVFTAGLGAEGTAASAEGLVYQSSEITFNAGSKLAITDAVYNLDYAESAGALLKDVNVVFQGTLASTEGIADEDNRASISDLENVGPNVVLEQVTATTASEANTDGGNLQIGGTTAEEGTVVRSESLSVGAVDLGVGDTVTITEGKALNLAGTGGEIITSTAPAAGDAPAVTISVEADSSLGLGVNAQSPRGDTLNAAVKLADTASMAVTGGAHYEVESVAGTGTVTVGDATSAGRLTINSIDGMSGLIFADPAWVDGVNLVSDASQVSLNFSAPITADIVAGQNSVIAMGTSASEAVSAFNEIAAANNLSWKDNVTAAVYIGTPPPDAQ